MQDLNLQALRIVAYEAQMDRILAAARVQVREEAGRAAVHKLVQQIFVSVVKRATLEEDQLAQDALVVADTDATCADQVHWQCCCSQAYTLSDVSEFQHNKAAFQQLTSSTSSRLR